MLAAVFESAFVLTPLWGMFVNSKHAYQHLSGSLKFTRSRLLTGAVPALIVALCVLRPTLQFVTQQSYLCKPAGTEHPTFAGHFRCGGA